MRRLLLFLTLCILFAVPAFGRGHISGIAAYSQVVTTVGSNSSNKFSRILVGATVTVYCPTSTLTLCTLYSDASGTSKANPFTAGSDGSYSFYTDAQSVDIRFSSVTGVSAFTLSDMPVTAGDTVTTVACGGVNDTTLLDQADGIGGTIVIPRSVICASNSQTLSSALDVQYGGLLKPITGQAVTLTGPQVAGPWQTFTNATSGQGTILFTGNKSLGRIYPQWWGATGDGSTDDLLPVRASLVAGAGCNVHFIAGSYLVSNGVSIPANTLVTGDGYASKIICDPNGWNINTSALTVGYGILNIKNVSKVRVTGLRIYGTKTAPIDGACDSGFPRNCHTPKLIYVESTSDGVMIDHNWLENTAWESIWEGGSLDSVLHVQVTNNQFKDMDGPSAVTGNFERAVVGNNIFQDCLSAIGITGRYVTVTGNQILGATGQGIGVGEIGDGGYVEVSGNVIQIAPTALGSWNGVGVVGASTNGIINVTGNIIQVTDSLGSAAGAGINISTGGKIDVNGNSIQGNGALYGVSCAASIDTTISIRNNTAILTSESVTPNSSRGFIVVATAGTTLLQSANNRVAGMTRANGNYPFDYRSSGGGAIVVAMEGDIKTEGNMRIGAATYSTSETDNVPLFLSADFTSSDAYTGRALLGMLRFRPAQSITIASGIITIAGLNGSNGLPFRQTRIAVDTETGTTDELDTINGGQDGDLLIVRSVNSGRDVTLKDGTGNLEIGSDFTLATTADRIMLTYDGTLVKWVQISRSTN